MYSGATTSVLGRSETVLRVPNVNAISAGKARLVINTWTVVGRLRLKRDGTRAETRFRLSAKRTSSFKSAGASVQSTTGSRGVRISGSNAGYNMFRGSVNGTGYPLQSPVFPSLPLPCVTVCHHISTGLYRQEAVAFRAFNYVYLFILYTYVYQLLFILLLFRRELPPIQIVDCRL